jgi:thioredoxin 1
MSVIDLSSDTLKKYLDDNMIIDFYASWCGPCKSMKPDFEEVSKEYDNIVFTKVDVDIEEDLSEKFNIDSLPTIIYIKNGDIIGKTEGKLTKEQIRENIKKLIL